MMQWLQNYTGLKSYGENVESSELENLKKQLKYYKKKYEKEDKEMEIPSDKEEEITPEDQKKIDDDIKKTQQKKKEMRIPISNQVYGILNKFIKIKEKKFQKTEEQKKKIKEKIRHIFIFNSLDEEELNKVIDSLEENNYSNNKFVIKQNENSEKFFLIEQGDFECEKIYRIGDPQTFIKTFRPGDYFGELSLLYNFKNPYSIISKSENGSLYSIDRNTFYNIIRNYEVNKREKNLKILKKIEILQNLTENEFLQICDALKLEKIQSGNKIIKQNDINEKLFIIDNGEAQGIKTIDGKPEQKLEKYNIRSYFGEISLLRNDINTFNIIAESDCKVFTIDRKTFKRLIGPLENILQRDKKIYAKYMIKP